MSQAGISRDRERERERERENEGERYYLQHEHERENGYAGEGQHVVEPGGAHPRDLEDTVEDDADDVVPYIQPASHNSLEGMKFYKTRNTCA